MELRALVGLPINNNLANFQNSSISKQLQIDQSKKSQTPDNQNQPVQYQIISTLFNHNNCFLPNFKTPKKVRRDFLKALNQSPTQIQQRQLTAKTVNDKNNLFNNFQQRQSIKKMQMRRIIEQYKSETRENQRRQLISDNLNKTMNTDDQKNLEKTHDLIGQAGMSRSFVVGNSILQDSMNSKSKQSFYYYMTQGISSQNDKLNKAEFHQNFININNQLNNSGQIKIHSKQNPNRSYHRQQSKPPSTQNERSIESNRVNEGKSYSKLRKDLRSNGGQSNREQMLQDKNLKIKTETDKEQRETQSHRFHERVKPRFNYNSNNADANDHQRSHEEKQSSDTQLSARNLQQYHDLLRPRGIDMFSSQLLKSEKDSRDEVAALKEIIKKSNQRSMASTRMGQNDNATLINEIMVGEAIYKDETFLNDQPIQELEMEYILSPDHNHAKQYDLSKLTSLQQTPPEWDSVYLEQRQHIFSQQKDHRQQNGLNNLLLKMDTKNTSIQKQITQQSRKMIVYQRDSKNNSQQTSIQQLMMKQQSQEIKNSLLKQSYDEEDCRDIGTSPIDINEDSIYQEESELNIGNNKEVIFQNIAHFSFNGKNFGQIGQNQQSNVEQNYITNQNVNESKFKIRKTKTPGNKSLYDYLNQGRRIIIKNHSGGKYIISPNKGYLQDSKMELRGHYIIPLDQKLKQEIMKICGGQSANSRDVKKQHIIGQFSSSANDYKSLSGNLNQDKGEPTIMSSDGPKQQQMPIYDFTPKAKKQIIDKKAEQVKSLLQASNLVQSRVSNITSSEFENSKMINYTNLYYGNHKYSDYQESRFEKVGRPQKINSEDFSLNNKLNNVITNNNHTLPSQKQRNVRQVQSPDFEANKIQSKSSLSNQYSGIAGDTNHKKQLNSSQMQRKCSSKRHSFDLSNFSKGDNIAELSFYNRMMNPIADIQIQNKSPIKSPKSQAKHHSDNLQFKIRKQSNISQNVNKIRTAELPVRKVGGLFAEISRQFTEAVSNRQKVFNSSGQTNKSLYSVGNVKIIQHEEVKLNNIREMIKENMNKTTIQEESIQNNEVLRGSLTRIGFKPKTPSDEIYKNYLSAATDKKQIVLSSLNKSQQQCFAYPFVISNTPLIRQNRPQILQNLDGNYISKSPNMLSKRFSKAFA
ncbi:UNKNOWN [Stylonychia lemnae]|uniref:Uncharacterized protein n=1 Tax=Stylonychia lemnae TaxID=5949 RepID=A0A078AX05_STYLE|nr:UNKNOWN [Stylonychia lemnae]|eukprot:CDW86699.1 UNKNOWN [Stylonychia lemnae]